MQIIKEKNTHRAVLMFSDDAELVLDASGLQAPELMVSDASSATHEIAVGTAPALPLYWVAGALAFVDGGWSISDQATYDKGLPQAEAEYQRKTAEMASQVRSERNARLAASDWTQLADAPVDKAVWATYRQALRDITSQAGFPLDVQWPQEPN